MKLSIERWVWTPRSGLRVHYFGQPSVRSDWRTLPAFLKAIKEGREHAVEIKL